jgi:hypothetical protein
MIAELLQLIIKLRDLSRQHISILEPLQHQPLLPPILVRADDDEEHLLLNPFCVGPTDDVQATCEPTNAAVEDLHPLQQEIDEVPLHGLLVDAAIPTNTVAAPFASGSFTNNYNDTEYEVPYRLPQAPPDGFVCDIIFERDVLDYSVCPPAGLLNDKEAPMTVNSCPNVLPSTPQIHPFHHLMVMVASTSQHMLLSFRLGCTGSSSIEKRTC